MRVLVTGGCGFIGANLIFELRQSFECEITIIDNLINCDNSIHLHEVDPNISILYGEISHILPDLEDQDFDIVVHLGAYAYVGESIINSDKYFGDNVRSTYELAKFAKQKNVKQFIFSSTCAIYGSQEHLITEASNICPESPYGYSKYFCEQIIQNELQATCSVCIFRFFNVAGANPDFTGGEYHDPETHLIPIVISKALRREKIKIFGGDYETYDGTCIREYVHVKDIAKAHILAIQQANSGVFNLGSGQPVSNLTVLAKIEEHLGIDVEYEISDRRVGDAVSLVSSYKRANDQLGWVPDNSDIDQIIADYHQWYMRTSYGN